MIYTHFTPIQPVSYTLYYFIRGNGRSPVEEYLKGINDHRQLAAIYRTFIRLQELGWRLPPPMAKHVEGKIWELRTRFGNRIFYALYDDDIIFLDGHTKKRDRLESRVLERIRKHYEEYLKTGLRKPY